MSAHLGNNTCIRQDRYVSIGDERSQDVLPRFQISEIWESMKKGESSRKAKANIQANA
jgi:hypothetical protein